MKHYMNSPFLKEDIARLRAGDRVYLSGTVYTARDAAHQRLCGIIDRGEALPFELSGSAVYYVGPTPERPGEIIGSAGPTTAGRMDAYSPRLIEKGQLLMIGKGARNKEVKDAIVKNGGAYLAAVGGAGALMADSVTDLEIVCWEDLGCEAVRRLEVKNLPLTGVIDSLGQDLYETGPKAYLESLCKAGV